MLRLVALVAIGACCAAGLGSMTHATPAATADLDIRFVTIGLPSSFEAKEPFTLQFDIGNNGPDASHFRVHVLLPSGIRLVNGGSAECSGTSDLTCAADNANPGYDASGRATFVADAAGSYTLIARLTELTATDPNLANNEASLPLNVVAAPAPPAPVLVASRLSIKPAHPVAGRRVVVSLRILDQTSGAYVKPSSARCTANLSRPTAGVVGNVATCTLRPPPTAHGKKLRGTLAVRADGIRVAKRFSIPLR